jgi:hypothetical protein
MGEGLKSDQFLNAQIFKDLKSRHLEKGQTIPLVKVHLFLKFNFLANRIDNLPSN